MQTLHYQTQWSKTEIVEPVSSLTSLETTLGAFQGHLFALLRVKCQQKNVQR